MLITAHQHNAEKLSKFWHAKNINNNNNNNNNDNNNNNNNHYNNNNNNSFTSFTGHLIGFILLGSFCQSSLEKILVEKEKEKR